MKGYNSGMSETITIPPAEESHIPISDQDKLQQAEPSASVKVARADAAPPSWMNYAVGGRSDAGDIVVEILQRSDKYFIFLNQEGSLQWEFEGALCAEPDDSSAQAFQLVSQVSMSGIPGKRRRRVLTHIADALANALASRRVGDTRDFFENARALVDITRVEVLHLTYLISAFASLIVISALLYTVSALASSDLARDFLMSSLLASVGAFVSVLLRFRAIQVETYTSQFYTLLGGTTRIVAGALFGAIFLLLHRAELLLTVLKTPVSVAAASVLAGFSERFVPELLAAFESRLTASPSSQ